MADPLKVGTPEWWGVRLLRRLEQRAPRMRVWDDYYNGVQPLAFASEKFMEAFGSRFPAFTSNFCSLVVDGTAERLEVQGFRFGTQAEADEHVWDDLWQANDLDAGSQLAHTEALIKGVAYALVEPRGAGVTPVITVEDALDTIVECDPRDQRKRLAGLKRWVDPEGKLMLVVYLPEGVYKYRSRKLWAEWDSAQSWWVDGTGRVERPGYYVGAMLDQADAGFWVSWGFEPYRPADDDAWPLANPTGVVPLVALPNRPRLRLEGQSEIQPIRSNQDAVNKYRMDALITSEFAAFPQRYLLNYEPETDTSTGRPREPFRAAIDRLWTVPPPDPDNPDAPEPKIGSLPSASLEPYERMIAMEVGHMSAISRLPYHYLLGTPQTVPPSGEGLKSSEAGLEHKVDRIELHLGRGWEEVMRVALLAEGDTTLGNERRAETIWRDTETRNEAVRTDAVVKLHAEGIIDDELSWELIGLSPQQAQRLKTRQEAAAAAQPAAPPEAPGAGPGTPPELAPAPRGPQMGV